MKKNLIVILVIFIAAFVIFYFLMSNRKITPLERQSNIPTQARWVGGADGGTWFEIIKALPDSSFRIKLYNDYSGEIIVDTIFVLSNECSSSKIDSTTLIKKIRSYDGENILLDLIENNKHCFLTPK
jgi:hypothetical protein